MLLLVETAASYNDSGERVGLGVRRTHQPAPMCTILELLLYTERYYYRAAGACAPALFYVMTVLVELPTINNIASMILSIITVGNGISSACSIFT